MRCVLSLILEGVSARQFRLPPGDPCLVAGRLMRCPTHPLTVMPRWRGAWWSVAFAALCDALGLYGAEPAAHAENAERVCSRVGSQASRCMCGACAGSKCTLFVKHCTASRAISCSAAGTGVEEQARNSASRVSEPLAGSVMLDGLWQRTRALAALHMTAVAQLPQAVLSHIDIWRLGYVVSLVDK